MGKHFCHFDLREHDLSIQPVDQVEPKHEIRIHAYSKDGEQVQFLLKPQQLLSALELFNKIYVEGKRKGNKK